jgi:hypothetical protein
MPLAFATNQYPGPNAHLLSLQQAAPIPNELWFRFHHQFIAAIITQLRERAPETYAVQVVPSLQNGEDNPATNTTAVLICPADAATEMRMEHVRIECLNPMHEEQHLAYANRRREMLEQGLILYEIELCHETQSLLPRPSYLVEPMAQAYAIGLTKPKMHTQWQGFGVDEPFPNLDMMLGMSETVPNLDLGRAYNHAFYVSKVGKLIDYSQPPDYQRDGSHDAALNKYSMSDQERIRARMSHIATLHEQGIDLDSVMPKPLV